MNEALKALIKLQERDTQIIEKKRYIDAVPLRIHQVDAPLALAQQDLQKIIQRKEALVKKRRERELQIEEMAGKIAKMRSRASEIKTNKEYQAHQKEIDASEAEIRSIEDTILQLMEETEAIQAEVSRQQEQVDKETAHLDAFRKQLDAEVARLQEELALLKKERGELVSRVDSELYRQYLKLLASAGGVAVTKAQNEICQGCNMNIPPQLFVEILKNEEIFTCPQCHRILYHAD